VVNSAGDDEATVAGAVVVEAGDLVDVVAGGDLSVVVEESAQLEASAVDEFGNEISDAGFVWAMVGSTGAVDDAGVFTAGTEAGVFAGLVEVTATAGSNSATSILDVTIQPGAPVEVAVEPLEATVGISDTESFAAVGVDEFGNEVSDVAASWSVNAGSGEIDADGVYTAGTTAGAYPSEIVANVSGAGSASADVVIPPDSVEVIDVQPSEALVSRGGTTTFTAVGSDQYGNVVSDLTITWSASGGEIDPAGVFVATVPGDHEITATGSAAGAEAHGSAQALVPPNYPDFSSVEGLNLVGTASQAETVLRLTPALPENQAGAAWTNYEVPVADGFETTFAFRLSGNSENAGDGLAFVIQTGTDNALGEAASGLGYKGLPGSVAIEVDTRSDGHEVDPYFSHISVHTKGDQSNTSDQSASVGAASTGTPDLGVPGPVITDGGIHTLRISYRPGIMDVYLDDLGTPFMTVWIDVAEELGIEDSARVGFTAAINPGFTDNHDVLSWTYTPGNPRPDEGPPQPPPPEAFDGLWAGVSGFVGQITTTVECCDGDQRTVRASVPNHPACVGNSEQVLEGTGRVDGAVLNVAYHNVFCVVDGEQHQAPLVSYYLQPDGSLVSSTRIVQTRQ
jgi:hypothetical protein